MRSVKMGKIISISVIICVFIALAPSALAYNAADYTSDELMGKRLTQLLAEYKPGSSYFVSSSVGHNLKGDKTKSCDTYGNSCGYFDSFTQCRAYAAYTQYILFGKTQDGTLVNSSVSGSSGIVYNKINNPTKAQIMAMPLGTHIRDTSAVHSIVLLKATASTITYLDCNCEKQWQCAVHLHTETWNEFFRGSGTVVYGYAAYPTSKTYPKDNTYKSTPFTDINAHWARDDIEKAYNLGIMSGVAKDTFAPNKAMTRAMITETLYNQSGRPAVELSEASQRFWDVPVTKWYASAIHWAAENDIVSGYNDYMFLPGREITRQETAVILYNVAGAETVNGDLTEFEDSGDIAQWAEEAMLWAVKSGIIKGDRGKLNPNGKLTRAQAVVILLRLEKYKEGQGT